MAWQIHVQNDSDNPNDDAKYEVPSWERVLRKLGNLPPNVTGDVLITYVHE